MGKLLQKIVNGVVPSWLTRVKSSTHAKRLLPPASNDTLDRDRSGRRSKNQTLEPAPASAESSVLSCSVDLVTPPSMPHKETNMKQKDGKHELCDTDDQHQCHSHKIHQFKDNNHDYHHLHHADMNGRSHGTIYNPATQIHAPNQQADEGFKGENHHPQHRHQQHHAERTKCDHVLLGSEKRSPGIQCVQEDDISHHHQKAQGGHHEQPNAKHKHSYVGVKREIGCVQEKQKNYHYLLGFKRKSTYSEEDEDEEEKGEGHRSRGMRGWGWKRRKREEGLMSCKLPEGIGSIVGNARAVVKYSQEPHHALWESMVEMIVGNGLWELDSLEFLLFCYLSLNESHLYSIIQSSFLKVLKDLERTF